MANQNDRPGEVSYSNVEDNSFVGTLLKLADHDLQEATSRVGRALIMVSPNRDSMIGCGYEFDLQGKVTPVFGCVCTGALAKEVAELVNTRSAAAVEATIRAAKADGTESDLLCSVLLQPGAAHDPRTEAN